jgi:hypothetical protein
MVTRTRTREGKRPPKWVYRLTPKGEETFQTMLRKNLAEFVAPKNPGSAAARRVASGCSQFITGSFWKARPSTRASAGMSDLRARRTSRVIAAQASPTVSSRTAAASAQQRR